MKARVLVLVGGMLLATGCNTILKIQDHPTKADGGSAGAAEGGDAGDGGASDAGGSSAKSTKGGTSSKGGTKGKGGTTGKGGAPTATGGTTNSVGGTTNSVGGTTNSVGGTTNSVGGTTNSVGGTTNSVGGTTSTADTTPPTVVAFSPSGSPYGMTPSTVVTFTFSEPMNTASVDSVVTVAPFQSFSIAWSNNSTVLTVTANQGWVVASGDSPASTPALNYIVTVGTGAKDVAGNPMVAASSVSFFTQRRITQKLAPISVGHYDTYGHATGYSNISLCSDSSAIQVGHQSLTISSDYYDFVLFNGSGANVTADSVESVRFDAKQGVSDSWFFPAGTVELQRLPPQSQLTDAVIDLVPTKVLGVLATSTFDDSPTVDVTDAFKSDLASTSYFLYRLAASGTSPENAYARFICNGFTLRVTTVLP